MSTLLDQEINTNFENDPAPASALPARASACLNALTHGGTAQKLFLPGEDPNLFEKLLLESFEEHKPATLSSAALVVDYVEARWYVWRRHAAKIDVETAIVDKYGPFTDWTMQQYHSIELCDRYVTQAERAFKRAQNNLRDVRKDESAEQRWLSHHILMRERLELDKKKAALAELKEERRHTDSQIENRLRNKRAAVEDKADEIIEKRKAPEPIQFNQQENCAFICQRAKVGTCLDGSAFIDDVEPSYEKVEAILSQLNDYVHPPCYVLRQFEFADGFPTDYRFLVDEGHRRPAEDEFRIDYRMTLERYRELVAQERQIIAEQPPPNDEDYDDEDDDEEEDE